MISLSLHIEAANLWHKRCGVWLPDGLHVWLNTYGVHLFWARSPHQRRVTFDRAGEEGSDA